MKKKIAVFLLAAVLTVGAVFALTACGGANNASAEGVAKSYITAQMKADFDVAVDCIYFESEEAKEEAKKLLSEMAGELKVTGSVDVTKVSVAKEYTAEEITAFASTSGITATITAVQDLKVTYSYDLKGTMTVDGKETTMEQTGTEEDEPLTVIEVDGKWYVYARM